MNLVSLALPILVATPCLAGLLQGLKAVALKPATWLLYVPTLLLLVAIGAIPLLNLDDLAVRFVHSAILTYLFAAACIATIVAWILLAGSFWHRRKWQQTDPGKI